MPAEKLFAILAEWHEGRAAAERDPDRKAFHLTAAARLRCDECDGRGEVLDASGYVLDGRTYWTPCPKCSAGE